VVIFTMDLRKEQRVCITFCANLWKSATKTLTDSTNLWGPKLESAQVFQRHDRNKTGRTSFDEDEHRETQKLQNSSSCTNSRALSSKPSRLAPPPLTTVTSHANLTFPFLPSGTSHLPGFGPTSATMGIN